MCIDLLVTVRYVYRSSGMMITIGITSIEVFDCPILKGQLVCPYTSAVSNAVAAAA